MRVLTAVPERWHLANIHSKSAMKHMKNMVSLSPEREDGRGLHCSLWPQVRLLCRPQRVGGNKVLFGSPSSC